MIDKILYFMDNYDSLGGAANTLLRQAVLMKQFGKTICVAVSKYGMEKVCPDYLKICEKANIPVWELDFSVTNQPEGVHVLSIIEHYEGVRDFIAGQKAALVHSVQLNPVVELACRELHIPHVMNIYQALPEFFVFPYPDIFAHYHICDSLYYAAFWKKYLGTKSYCVRTVAKRGDKGTRRPDKKEPLFICAGLLCERKNQLEVIKAFEIAADKGLRGRLELWGHEDSLYGAKCRQYILDNQLGGYIEVKGFSDNMEEIYENSTALICGSMSESYPNVISEALANHVMVIATPVAGVPEIIKDRENGYLCKGYSAEEIAAGILSFVEDMESGAVDEISNLADVTYETVHSQKAVTQKLADTYEDILLEYKKEDRASYGMGDLKRDFKGCMEAFSKYQNVVSHGEFIKRNLWKIHFVVESMKKMVLERHRRCYIWGTGTYGGLYKEILEMFAPDIKISGFIDSYKTGDFMGYEISPAEILLDKDKNIVLIGVLNCREIMLELEGYGYQYGADYFKFESILW